MKQDVLVLISTQLHVHQQLASQKQIYHYDKKTAGGQNRYSLLTGASKPMPKQVIQISTSSCSRSRTEPFDMDWLSMCVGCVCLCDRSSNKLQYMAKSVYFGYIAPYGPLHEPQLAHAHNCMVNYNICAGCSMRSE